MSSRAIIPSKPSQRGEPVWELVELFPEQGSWSEAAYLKLTTNRLVEFNDGCLEVLPMPDAVHQMIVLLLCSALSELSISGKRGRALPAPFRLRIREGRWREPDVLYLAPRSEARFRKDWWDYADLVVEVVSADDPERDYVEKRKDYAAAGVPEYWIVDPLASRISVLVLEQGAYREIQVATLGQTAISVTVPGFDVDVSELLERARA